MRISDWSSDVCSSDLRHPRQQATDDPRDERAAARDGSHRALGPVQPRPPDLGALHPARDRPLVPARTLTMRKQFTLGLALAGCVLTFAGCSGSPQPPAGDEMMTTPDPSRSEENTSELQSLKRISYA